MTSHLTNHWAGQIRHHNSRTDMPGGTTATSRDSHKWNT